MVDFSITVADAAIGWRRTSKNKENGPKNTVCFTAVVTVELEKLHRTRLFFNETEYE